jgi:hypothetical protein
MLHGMDNGRYETTLKLGGFDFLKKMKAEGKARNIGFSFHDKAIVLDRILKEQPELDFVLLQINYVDWDNKAIQSGECYKTALKYNKSIMVMEPVKGGCLASLPEEAEKLLKEHNSTDSMATWAMRFAGSLENVLVVLSGMSTIEEITDNAACLRNVKPFSEQEEAVIKKAARIINDNIAIPCTNCAYCLDDCPRKIHIPQFFTLFNNYKRYGLLQTLINTYEFFASKTNKASACINCKKCEEQCPQHINIIDWLKEVAKVFEKK